MWFLFFFVIAPIIELAVIIEVGIHIGAVNTAGLLILAALIGFWLIRRAGTKVFRRFAQSVQSKQVPTRQIANDVCMLAAGILFVLPGFITDVIALLLVFPPTRALARNWLMRRRSLGGLAKVKVIRANYGGTMSGVTDANSTEVRGELDP